MRIGWEIGSLRICSAPSELARSEMWRVASDETKSNNRSARLPTNHRERPGQVSAIHLYVLFFCFRLRLARTTLTCEPEAELVPERFHAFAEPLY